jgi:hypothetical protein
MMIESLHTATTNDTVPRLLSLYYFTLGTEIVRVKILHDLSEV